MKRNIMIAVVLMTPLLSLAQERFYDLYEGWIINEIVIKNGQYYTYGLIGHPTNDGSLPQFNIIGENGVLQDSFYYYSDTTEGLNVYRSNAYLMREDTIIFVGSYIDYSKAYTLSPIMMRYNLDTRNMDTIIRYNHCIPGTSQGILYLIDTTATGYVLTGDYEYNSQNSFPMLIFTNRAGDTLGVKQYTFLAANPYRRRVFPYQTLQVPTGGYLVSCQDEIGPYVSWPDKQRAWFVRLDNAGNELWRRTTATQDTLCFHPFAFIMPDGDYLITWSDPYLDNAINEENRSIWLARMDDNGTISQKRRIHDYIDDLPNKKFLVNDYYQDTAGNIYLVGEATYYTQPGFILKINPQGEAVWYRDYVCFPDNTTSGAYTKFYSITPTPDGGFIMGGEYYSPSCSMFPSGVQKGLVVKVDECGCLEEGCNPDCYNGYGTQTIRAMQAAVYPNPASDVVTVNLPVKGSTARIELFDATGCQWVDVETECMETETGSQVKLNLNGLPAGVYVMNVWIGGKLCVGKVARE